MGILIAMTCAGTQNYNRVWSQQGDRLDAPEAPVGLTFPNYNPTNKSWKPAASPVAIKMFNVAAGLFGIMWRVEVLET